MNLSQSTDRIGMNAEDALRKAEMPDDCFWHQEAYGRAGRRSAY
jgi:hypothetical protein